MSMMRIAVAATVCAAGLATTGQADAQWRHRSSTGEIVQPRGPQSIAREWNDLLLDSIRKDFARPTVHARNLFHTSGAMWDAWAAYDDQADTYRHHERQTAQDVQAAREEAISFAMYRLLRHRFQNSPGFATISPEYDQLMADHGYDVNNTSTVGDTPAALGNRIAETYIQWGLVDGANEQINYGNEYYKPRNQALLPAFAGNPNMVHPNRWQPLALDFFIDQSGNLLPTGEPEFLSPEWGNVDGFALRESDRNSYYNDYHEADYHVWHDPGTPPRLGHARDEEYKNTFAMVAVWSGHLDQATGVMIDASPNAIGNADVLDPADWETFYDFLDGGDNSAGYDVNPVTGQPYEEQVVPLGDYSRILAEFWADGPDSETPPGHWFTLLNYVADHPEFEKRFMGEGPVLDDLEFDVKVYFTMGGAMHDSAVSAWSVKGWYDYLRPISAIRYMAGLGQSTDPNGPSYHPDGIPLVPGYIEVITPDSAAPGERHAHLFFNIGEIALNAWRGPGFITDPDTDQAGVGWILASRWWPYQRPSFVSPPFAGYVSGHSTFSRAAAEVMTLMTGSPYFPAGMGEFVCPENQFLVFEEGPSMDVVLQWAGYGDASDQCSLSRIWGGIHPPADDLPGRHMGFEIGPDAFWKAKRHIDGRVSCPGDINLDGDVTASDFNAWIDAFNNDSPMADVNDDGMVAPDDFNAWIAAFQAGCD